MGDGLPGDGVQVDGMGGTGQEERLRNDSPSDHGAAAHSDDSAPASASADQRTLAVVSVAVLALALMARAFSNALVRQSLVRACHAGLTSGVHGALAGLVQVFLLMWLRTTMNYQCARGTRLWETLVLLWREGGVPRFYQGFWFACVQAPLTRFGDVTANEGVRHLFEGSEALSALPTSVRSLVVSSLAVTFRLLVHPLDSVKTNMQIYGPAAHKKLVARIHVEGPYFLFDGAAAGSISNFIGQYPYWLTYNALAPFAQHRPFMLALCALAATCVSDCFANTFRVLKTARQTMAGVNSYAEVARVIIRTDGVRGLLGRALLTRMVTNSVQAVVFTLVLRRLKPAGPIVARPR